MYTDIFEWPFLGGIPRGRSYNFIESGTEFVIETPVPGLTKEDITVSLDSGDLLLKAVPRGEEGGSMKKYLRQDFSIPEFTERLVLPEGTSREGITARVKDGVLTIKVPKGGSPSVRIEVE